MDEGTIGRDLMVPTNDETPKVADPRKGAFNFPSSLVSTQLASILRLGLLAVATMGANQVNAASLESLPQRIGIGRAIIDQSLGILTRSASPGTRHGNLIECGFDQRNFVGGRRVQVDSKRNTLAVDHHHPLCTLAAFGLADAEPPFLAGAKLPSAKVSAQSSWPCSSSSLRKARHALSHTSCSSHSNNRRRQVLYDGKQSGMSFHRAPLRSTHKRPSNTGRLGIGLGPPRDDARGSGSRGSILNHCSSVSSDRCLAMKRTPFHGRFHHNCANSASL